MRIVIAGAHGQVARRLGRLLSGRVDEVAEVVSGADAVVFAAGAGAGSGEARKHTVDKGAALLLADAAERGGVRPYLLVSSMGVEQGRQGTPRGMDPVFAVYLQAKLAAEDAILPRPGLDTVVLRPGRLTDEPGTGRVTLAHGVEYGEVPRDDVAAVLLALLDARKTDEVVELVSGDTPIEEAVAALPWSHPGGRGPGGPRPGGRPL